MKDYTIPYKIHGKQLRLHLLYLPEAHIWEVFIDTPIENTLAYRPNDATDYIDIPPYHVDNVTAEHTYHQEAWGISADWFWDYALTHDMNMIYENGSEELWLSETDFYYNSDAGYFCIAEYMMSWFEENIMLF